LPDFQGLERHAAHRCPRENVAHPAVVFDDAAGGMQAHDAPGDQVTISRHSGPLPSTGLAAFCSALATRNAKDPILMREMSTVHEARAMPVHAV
jgi:hypothetical protein